MTPEDPRSQEDLVQQWAADPEGRRLVQNILDRKATEAGQ